MWTVNLTKPTAPGLYRDGFFPYHYDTKASATWLAAEVKKQGGEAIVLRTRRAPR